ncbi:hypothetical protein EON62_02595, partial [archaeon]
MCVCTPPAMRRALCFSHARYMCARPHLQVRIHILFQYECLDEENFRISLAKQNLEQLTANLIKLIELYDDARQRRIPHVAELVSPNVRVQSSRSSRARVLHPTTCARFMTTTLPSPLPPRPCVQEAEFQAYRLMLTMASDNIAVSTLQGSLQRLPAHILDHPHMQRALEFWKLFTVRALPRFVKLIQAEDTPYCLAIMAHRLLPALRMYYLELMLMTKAGRQSVEAIQA